MSRYQNPVSSPGYTPRDFRHADGISGIMAFLCAPTTGHPCSGEGLPVVGIPGLGNPALVNDRPKLVRLNEFSGLKLNCLKRRSDQCFAQSSIAIMKIFQSVCWSKVSRYSLQKAKHLRSIQDPGIHRWIHQVRRRFYTRSPLPFRKHGNRRKRFYSFEAGSIYVRSNECIGMDGRATVSALHITFFVPRIFGGGES